MTTEIVYPKHDVISYTSVRQALDACFEGTTLLDEDDDVFIVSRDVEGDPVLIWMGQLHPEVVSDRGCAFPLREAPKGTKVVFTYNG